MIMFIWAVIAIVVLVSVPLIYMEHEWGLVRLAGQQPASSVLRP
jgi:hypothetical protein